MGTRLRPLDLTADLGWAEPMLVAELAGRLQARRGELVDALVADGLVAEVDGRPVGLVTWVAESSPGSAPGAEIRVLVVAPEARGHGVGGALLGGALRAIEGLGVGRAWLATTNDNLDALGFYQRRGWRLAELYPGAVDEARRRLKPAIGTVGANRIPIRDELVLAIELGGGGLTGRPQFTGTSARLHRP